MSENEMHIVETVPPRVTIREIQIKMAWDRLQAARQDPSSPEAVVECLEDELYLLKVQRVESV